MKKIIVILIVIVLLSGCIGKEDEDNKPLYKGRGFFVDRFHDDEKLATCWVTTGETLIVVGGDISCIPDSQLNSSKGYYENNK